MIRRFLYKVFGWQAYIQIEAWRQRREFSRYAYRDLESAHLAHFVNKGDICLDVGANLGTYAFYLAKIVSEMGKVFAFEPVPATYKGLVTNVARARLANVKAYNLGVSDRGGEAELFVPERVGLPSHGRAHLHAPEAQERGEPIKIQLTTLDAFCAAHEVERVDFIKMDIEGAELLALRGAVEVISADRPSLLLEIEESHTSNYGYSPQDVFDMLDSLGYRDVYCVRGNELVRLSVTELRVRKRPFSAVVEEVLGDKAHNFFVTP